MRAKVFYTILTIAAAGSLVFLTYFWNTPESVYPRIQENLNRVITEQWEDLQLFENNLSIYTNPFNIQEGGDFSKKVYVNGSLVYWNDHTPLPGYSEFKHRDTLYTLSNSQGLFVVQRKQVATDADLVEIFSLLPLKRTPRVNNQYLQPLLNKDVFEDYPVSLMNGGENHLLFNGQHLLDIHINSERNQSIEIICFSLVLCLVVLFSRWVAVMLRRVSGLYWQLSLLSLTILLMRLVLYAYSSSQISHWSIFDPIHLTSLLGSTVGDLLLNISTALILLSVWLPVRLPIGPMESPDKARRIWLLLLVLHLYIISYGAFLTVSTILTNSQIALDISTSIYFDGIRIVALAAVVGIGIIFVLLFNVAISLLHQGRYTIQQVAMVLILHLILFVAWVGVQKGVVLIFTAAITSILLLLARYSGAAKYQNLLSVVLVVSAFAAIVTRTIYLHDRTDDLIAKQKFANTLLIRNDILGELYLNDILREIENDRYIRTRLMSSLLSRQNIREKIKRQFLSSYFTKYDIHVYLFDPLGTSLQEGNVSPLSQWQEEYGRPEHRTDYPNIYFIQDPKIHNRGKYVCFLNIEAYGRDVGSIVMELTLKKYIPASVFPELLLESKYYLGAESAFDYAIYEEGAIAYKQGKFGFENQLTLADLQNPNMYETGIEKNDARFYGLQTQDGRNIIITSKAYTASAVVGNFSFMFLLVGLTLAFGFVAYNVISNTAPFNLSTKIQLYLTLSFLLPMLVVIVALINTLNQSYKEEIDRNFQKRSFNLAENLIDETEAFSNNQINIDEYANTISEYAALVQTDLNIYSTEGRLLVTSQPEIFRHEIGSNLLNAQAFYELKYGQEENLITDEAIGKLEFKNSYTALRSYQDGRLLAILSLPYFDSKNHLRRQQEEVFLSLISIFTIIFLVTAGLGNFIVASLVSPLREIGDKLRATSLQGENQPIQYTADDEIGRLVREYNLMLLKLEESKEALATSQKESAWKEIARQVAHEIKNPLTPMRLKIQQMMKGFDPADKQYKACAALIDQVDSLSSIADSFSEFAKMPAPRNEVVDLTKLIDSTLDLYVSSKVDITRQYHPAPVQVWVDPKIFSRVFTNLLLNAIQASPEGRCSIKVTMKAEGRKVLLSVTDYGTGIPEEVKENIFTPYFSTKSTGSGIGLAVAKKGIENAGGNIWFESETGVGTTFYLSLPLHHS